MSHKIKHSGIIEEITEDCMRVRIVQTSACASCKVASQCVASEKKEKVVDVYHYDQTVQYHPGETVTVMASSQVGMNAVTVAFGIPFLLMVGIVFITSRFTDSEPLMAVSGLCSLIPYYILLYLFRDKIREKFAFSVE